MRQLSVIFLLVILASCQENRVDTGSKPPGSDSTINIDIAVNIVDSSITNSTNRTVDVLVNGVDNYLGGKHDPRLNFSTECMVCEPVLSLKDGFLFGRRLKITSDSVVMYKSDQSLSDTTAKVNVVSFYGEKGTKKSSFSAGNVLMKYQGRSCNDADFVSVELKYDDGSLIFNQIIYPSFFEFDLDHNGIKEQYLLGIRNCSQELVLLRINEPKSDL